MSLVTIVIPCYNEYHSLPTLFQKARYITSNYDIEFIFVDNGSLDKTWRFMKKEKKNDKIKLLRITKNNGYGYGIKFALNHINSSYFGWTHADLQTDLFDLIKVFEIIVENNKENNNNLLCIKGIRYGRKFSEKLTSFFMSLITKTFFFPWATFEINAQPSIYHSSLKPYLKKSPNDYNFDVYAYLLSFFLNFEQRRFPVLFPTRIHGKSHWNINFFYKIKFISNTFLFIIEMFIKIKIFPKKFKKIRIS